MDTQTLLAGIDFARARLLGLLDAIEKSGHDAAKVLAWRPGPGRAHLGWQAMHCAATHDRYVNVRLRGATESDPDLVKRFAGGTTPSDADVPTLAEIREKLTAQLHQFREYVTGLTPADLVRVQDFPNNVRRTVGESILLLTWHEAHHQGQMHLMWNLYKAAHS
jgi:hypothetical protein